MNTFYCGSYCGYGFHEDGIQSAAHIAKILGVNYHGKEIRILKPFKLLMNS